MRNIDIRVEITKADLKFKEIAKHLGMARTSFSRKLTHNLSDKERKRILQAIEELKQQKESI